MVAGTYYKWHHTRNERSILSHNKSVARKLEANASKNGGILRQTSETPQFGDEFWNKNDDERKSIETNSAKLFVNNLELNDELKDLYLNFAKLLIGLQYDESDAQELQEQVKLIVEKESN